ncbi:MAG: ATP-binding protein [Boseongicola sp.]|nr:ATP-binding protein [Boseongicola sp.]
MSARSFGNYDLAGALADLIDNSLKARARKIELSCFFNSGSPEVRVADDGHGMSETELRAAMRPASQNPQEKRSPDDLGRFGWGMKSASFSQCSRLTVISTKDGKTSGAVWDLNTLDNWQMGVLTKSEVANLATVPDARKSGTEVIWNDCDRLSESGTMSEAEFNALVAHTKNRLSLTFHRFLSGEVRGKKLSLSLNGQPVEPYDPFFSHHNATQPLPPESLLVGGKKVTIRGYVLPHFSKLKATDHDRLAGEEGFLKNQGFYVYRNHRLIIRGTWFRLVKYGELAQLVRISVDIPNSIDDLWKITVDKSDAQLPAVLRTRLRQIVDGLRKRSARVNRSKGGKVSTGSRIAVWDRYARSGEINYHINREHPLIASLLGSGNGDDQANAKAALLAIEQGFPVEAFGQDAASRPDDIHQTEVQADRFRDFLESAVPIVLVQAGGNFRRLERRLRQTEPFCSNWVPVEEYLKQKGWVDAKS